MVVLLLQYVLYMPVFLTKHCCRCRAVSTCSRFANFTSICLLFSGRQLFYDLFPYSSFESCTHTHRQTHTQTNTHTHMMHRTDSISLCVQENICDTLHTEPFHEAIAKLSDKSILLLLLLHKSPMPLHYYPPFWFFLFCWIYRISVCVCPLGRPRFIVTWRTFIVGEKKLQ